MSHYKLVAGGVHARRVASGPNPEDVVVVPQRGYYKRVDGGVKFSCPVCGAVGTLSDASISADGSVSQFTCPEGHIGSATLISAPATKGPDQVATPSAAVASGGAK